ncbi:glycosyltransferase family 2 protein [Rubrivirga sp.]|uniref:glycosyltransferase family 2 protein n=1 Tax=Rubrivirga sp. TaxID=1885344 RepID=UPI003B517437
MRPDLSVVLVGAGDARSIRKSFRHLAAQTIQDRVEVIVAVPSAEALDLESLPTDGFWGVEVVSTGPLVSTARSRVPAVRAASAPIVAFVEDHSFQPPTWAERLVEAHRGPYAAVAPVLSNANPNTATSRANFLIEYGPWLWADGPTEPEHLPGHNDSYKRDVLLAYGDRLGEMLEAESLIHWDLRARGERLLLLPDLRVEHVNHSLVSAAAQVRLNGGRAFAAARSREWPWAKRALYALAAPAIPAVRFARTLRSVWGTPSQGAALRTIPALAGFLALDGLGEMMGYALGVGNATAGLSAIEVQRERFVRDDEKPLLLDT